MRWYKKPAGWKDGARRSRGKFLFLPLRIGTEVRWLEKVFIQEKAVSVYSKSFCQFSYKHRYLWKPIEWL